MKIKLLVILLVGISGFAFADESMSFKGISVYEDNYVVGGYSTSKHPLMFQISIKYPLLYPYTNSGLFISYSETATWNVQSESKPFYDIAQSPSLFYSLISKENILNNVDLGLLDFWSFGIRHKSNGKDGENSKSSNYVFSDIQCSLGDSYNVGVYNRYTYYFYNENHTTYYQNYAGDNETKLFIKIKSPITTEFSVTVGQYINTKEIMHEDYMYSNKYFAICWYKLQAEVRLFDLAPKFFVQYFQGYCENMLDYTKKDTAIRVGIKF